MARRCGWIWTGATLGLVAVLSNTSSLRTEQPLAAGATCAYVDAGRNENTHQPAARVLERSAGSHPRVAVRHLGRNYLGNLVVESAHFRVVHSQTPQLMEKVARLAEATRARINRKWFGDTPYEWDGKCTIYLFANHKLYARMTKQSGALAHADVEMSAGFVNNRSISLPCDVPGVFEDVLPHEVTHAVMANRFNGQTPRWADEGMANLSETAASREVRHKCLAAARQKGDLFAVEVLLQTQDRRHINCLEYYAQSMSLVEFFVAQRGRHTFCRFLKDSIQGSYEEALKKHYDIHSFRELNQRWLAFAFPAAEPLPSSSLASLAVAASSRAAR
jgi:hypothetical protein